MLVSNSKKCQIAEHMRMYAVSCYVVLATGDSLFAASTKYAMHIFLVRGGETSIKIYIGVVEDVIIRPVCF
jgi:hypothetical protein